MQFSPENFHDYELIDSGDGEKLERFGIQIVRRPDPQALWDKSLSEDEWQNAAQAHFVKSKPNDLQSDRGEWKLKPNAKEQWFVQYQYKACKIKMRLGLTAFKHVGIFPEQAVNWNFIFDQIKSFSERKIKILNLFAYTGGASLAAQNAGAEVFHVDSVKQVVNWASENAASSNIRDIHWVVEDAVKFVRREAKRGNIYQGIILDPPAYGRGPEGEKWVLEEQINSLLKVCETILDKDQAFVILNLYSMGFSATIAKNLLLTSFADSENCEAGELAVSDQAKRYLPLGVFARFSRKRVS